MVHLLLRPHHSSTLPLMSNIDTLPEDCVAAILSFTSPADVSRFLSVSSSLRSPALSDLLWLSFLPSDYPDLLSRSVTPVVSSSKRDLFFALSVHSSLILAPRASN
ncbi:hypothetical protein K1719_036959 [Acacia pycnantha]|nr:hypothetical protein K1719_036959 [Acacia pycnantha]